MGRGKWDWCCYAAHLRRSSASECPGVIYHNLVLLYLVSCKGGRSVHKTQTGGTDPKDLQWQDTRVLRYIWLNACMHVARRTTRGTHLGEGGRAAVGVHLEDGRTAKGGHPVYRTLVLRYPVRTVH